MPFQSELLFWAKVVAQGNQEARERDEQHRVEMRELARSLKPNKADKEEVTYIKVDEEEKGKTSAFLKIRLKRSAWWLESHAIVFMISSGNWRTKNSTTSEERSISWQRPVEFRIG